MRKVRIAWLMATIVAAAFAMTSSHADSGACSGGETTPAGVSVKANPAPNVPPADSGSITVCNDGAVVPAPAEGSVTAAGGADGTGYIDVDGDADNVSPSGEDCTTGFVRVAVDENGPHFYEAEDGNYDTDRDPNTAGTQRKAEESPDAWAQSIAANCGG